MSKVLKVILALVIVGGVAFLILKKNGEGLDKESKAYADDVIVKIVSTWNKEELVSRASPEFLQVMNTDPNGFEKVLEMWKRLGNFKEYKGSQGQAGMNFSPKGKQVIAQYVSDVEFDNAPAKVMLIIEKREGHWLIHKFHVDSKFFLQ